MVDKQILINYQKNTIHRLQQECKELKNIINEAKNSGLDLKSFLVGEAVQNEYEQKLDELKTELEHEKALKETYLACYKAKHEDINGELFKLKQTLAEIKEIVEVEIECKTYEIENDCFNETRCKALNEHIDFIKQILQKISESEVQK